MGIWYASLSIFLKAAYHTDADSPKSSEFQGSYPAQFEKLCQTIEIYRRLYQCPALVESGFITVSASYTDNTGLSVTFSAVAEECFYQLAEKKELYDPQRRFLLDQGFPQELLVEEVHLNAESGYVVDITTHISLPLDTDQIEQYLPPLFCELSALLPGFQLSRPSRKTILIQKKYGLD